MIDFGNPAQLMQLLQNPGRLANLLAKGRGNDESPGAIFADVFNTIRADTAQLAEVHGVREEMDIEMMTEDRAADLLASVITGQGDELIAAFNREAARRDRVIRAALDDEDEYREFMQEKLAVLQCEANGEYRAEDLYADSEPIDVESEVLSDGGDEGGA